MRGEFFFRSLVLGVMEGIYDHYDDDLHNAPSISQLLLGVNLIVMHGSILTVSSYPSGHREDGPIVTSGAHEWGIF